MLSFGLIDGILREPLGGAHSEPEKMAQILKQHILQCIDELNGMTTEDRINSRIEKYSAMGVYDIAPAAVEVEDPTKKRK